MRAAFLAVALLAAGCATASAPAPEPSQEADTCGMARFEHLIGAPAADIDRATLPPRTRVITPDTVVTMDYSAERLNIMVGADGRVGSLRCF